MKKLRYKILCGQESEILEVGESEFLFTAFNIAVLAFDKKVSWVKILDTTPKLTHKLDKKRKPNDRIRTRNLKNNR